MSEIEVELESAVEVEDEELLAMKQSLQEMEKEAEKLREMQAAAEKDINMTTAAGELKEEVDGRSVYVGNVDYSTTPEELQKYFESCGTINRVTIICDKFGGPKGFAYIEFADSTLVPNAVVLNDSMFKGRQIKVIPKRTNVPGMNRGRGRGRGSFRGYRGGGGGGFYGGAPYRGRGGFRGRRGAYFAPY